MADITAGALKRPEGRIIADLLLRGVDAAGWKDPIVVKTDLLSRSPSRARRLTQQIGSRLEMMVVLGGMSLGGSIIPVENLAELLRIAFNFASQRLPLSMASVKNIPVIPGELFANFRTGFYADPMDAVFKVLGVP